MAQLLKYVSCCRAAAGHVWRPVQQGQCCAGWHAHTCITCRLLAVRTLLCHQPGLCQAELRRTGRRNNRGGQSHAELQPTSRCDKHHGQYAALPQLCVSSRVVVKRQAVVSLLLPKCSVQLACGLHDKPDCSALWLQAIAAAHEDTAPGAVSYASGELLGANINRSPTAYLANPPAERAQYTHDVDKAMELLRIVQQGAAAAADATSGSSSGKDSSSSSSSSSSVVGRGMVSWFPVHCTSMNNTNPFVSGDNKGAAAQFAENAWRQQHVVAHHTKPRQSRRADSWFGWYWRLLQQLLRGRQPSTFSHASEAGKSAFVAAFAQSSVGDTSPNVQGAFCLDTGEQQPAAKTAALG